jgi:DUF4097 and DUF4098 domain-containing protein YvlB
MRSETFQTPRQLAVSAKLPRGDIAVETTDAPEAVVILEGRGDRAQRQIEAADIRLENRGDYDELIVDADPDDISWSAGRVKLAISFDLRKDSIGMRIRVPHGTILRASSGSADIRAAGRYRELETKTGSGDIAVDHVEQHASIKVASGDVRVDRVDGTLKVQTAAGDVSAGPVGADADVKTASGDIRLDDVGGNVSVHSASGDVRVGAVQQGKVELKSVSGDMVVGVRRGSRVWMDVKTVTGDAHSELDAGGEDDAEGPLVELKATAMSGDIRIVRAG